LRQQLLDHDDRDHSRGARDHGYHRFGARSEYEDLALGGREAVFWTWRRSRLSAIEHAQPGP
jgi:hypothetical protein